MNHPSNHFVFAIFLLAAIAAAAQAHPVPLAQASVSIDTKQARFEVLFTCDVTAIVMGTEPGHLGDDVAAQLAALTDTDLGAEVDRKREWFAAQLELRVDGEKIAADEITFPPLADIREVGESPTGGVQTEPSTITIRATLPGGARSLVLRFPADCGGGLLVASRDGKNLSPSLFDAGAPCAPLPLGDGSVPQAVSTIGAFVGLGFWHIIPTGPDHILFVLGLFLLSPTLKPLLWQVTAFTLAHSVTLTLAMNDLVQLPSRIVEPLIAASIAFIAIENVFTTRLHPWRPVVVFAFGLLHGLGFAGVMSDLRVPREHFVPALVGFNLGVEVGQLTVIAFAFVCVGWFRSQPAYRARVTIPASLAIAAIGAFWTVQRMAGG